MDRHACLLALIFASLQLGCTALHLTGALSFWRSWGALLGPAVMQGPFFLSSSSSSEYSSLSGRRLLQQQQKQNSRALDVPQCLWNEVREVCSPHQLAYLAVNAKPSTILHKAAVMAYDRNLVCSGHVNEVRCNKDSSNRCMYWNKSCVGSDAYELVNWIGGDVLDGQSAVAAFTCKGTVAAAYRVCTTAGDAGADGICNQLPGCQYVSLANNCLPVSLDSQLFKQVQNIKKGYDSFSPSVWGSCAGSCYVRQAAACHANYNSTSACTKKPFCVWDLEPFEGKKVCMHRDTASRGSDPFSKEYAKIKDSCNKAKSQEACEKPLVVPKNVGVYRNSKDAQRITEEKAPACPL